MIKTLLNIALVSSLMFCHKYPANVFFCRQDLPLTVFHPMTQAELRFNQGDVIYYYIYSTKKFNTDQLFISFVNLDNKGVFFAKPEITQTVTIDVDPEATATKGKIVMVKDGQFVMRVINPYKPDEAIAQADLWIE